MKCNNCNAEIQDGSVFCTNCGMKIDQAPNDCINTVENINDGIDTVQNMNNGVNAVKNTNTKKSIPIKLIAIIGVAVAVIIVALVLLLGGKGYSSYEDVVDAYTTAIRNNDGKKLMSTLNDAQSEYIQSKLSYLKVANALEGKGDTSIEDIFVNTLREGFGINGEEKVDISYSITSVSDATSSKKQSLAEELTYNDKASKEDIGDIKKVRVKFTYPDESGETKNKTRTLYIAEVKGKWYFCINS